MGQTQVSRIQDVRPTIPRGQKFWHLTKTEQAELTSVGTHEAAYLDHCRRYQLGAAPRLAMAG